jgi:DNA (cytosine-5)-methyltransferase 1
VGRVVDGLAARVERLRAIGNGQVPQCAAVAFELLSS